MNLTTIEIVEATGGQLVRGAGWNIIRGISTDSRTIKPGQLFVALVGDKYDGHDFIKQAVSRGATCLLVHKDVGDVDVPVVKVENTLQALKKLAAYYRSMHHLTVIGVTGSTGKTTTKEMIYSVLSQKYSVLKSEGNLNNQIGVPLTIFNLMPYHQFMVLEMGMSGMGEIHDLAYIARPQIGVITNIGVSHIEKLGSQENILKAKLELFDFFDGDDLAILNGDDPLLKEPYIKLPCRVLYFSTKGNSPLKVLNVHLYERGCYCYTVVLPDGQQEDIYLKLDGFHNVSNSLAAILIGWEAGIPLKFIKNGVESVHNTPQRLNIIPLHRGIKIIDDSYNASPSSMAAAIEVLVDVAQKRKLAVLGDMLEIGPIAEEAHRQVGYALADKDVDVVITVGDLAKIIAQGFIAARSKDKMKSREVYSFVSNEQAEEWLKKNLQPDDTVLIKGSHGMHMDEIVKNLVLRDKGVLNEQ